MININNAVQFQHLLWDRIMNHAFVVVDATCGNGHDLLYLAERARSGCHLYGIDIQEQAIESSRNLLSDKRLNADVSITFLHTSHDIALAQEIRERAIDLIIFNLGYLPGGDHTVMTNPHQTINAIQRALPKLCKDGIITVVAYPGTPTGAEEQTELINFLSGVSQRDFNVCHWAPMNQINNPPVLYMIQRR